MQHKIFCAQNIFCCIVAISQLRLNLHLDVCYRSANIWRFNLHLQHSTKYETVTKIQDIFVAKLRFNYQVHCNVVGICRFRRSVANCDRWPTSQVLLCDGLSWKTKALHLVWTITVWRLSFVEIKNKSSLSTSQIRIHCRKQSVLFVEVILFLLGDVRYTQGINSSVFHRRPVHVGFAVDKVHLDGYLSKYFGPV